MLTLALSDKNRKDYNSAIYKLKNLIDNYETSRFKNKAVGELYMTYSLKDTGVIQSNTTSLFNNLKEYLGDKIEQYESNPSILQKAYSYYLMCLTKTLNYNEAILGYENIMENHPDTVRCLLASWDRSANVLLQQGSGGGDNYLNENQKLEKLYKDKPIHLLVKNAFKKMTSTTLSREFKNGKNEVKDLSSRITRFNPQTRDELDSKISKDAELLFGFNKTKDALIQNIIPSEYKLNQNYPNPFNPITTISFELPYDEFVELKIYDITGKELMTLVSEIKTAGNYSVSVNGSNLSSGVYFYKMKSGNFEMVRKMMLIK